MCALISSVTKPVSAILVFLLLARIAVGQENLDVFNYWHYDEGSPSTSLYRHLCQRAFHQLEQRQRAIEKLKTPADWQKRQADVRAKLRKVMGPFPEKTPLNPVITGTIQRDDFTVEKLYFESRPGYFVTAALFLPKNRPGKLPAILYCSGHSINGFRSEAYQRIILNYVKKGFAVLAFDPIGQGERRQYADESVVRKSAVNEHSYPGAQSFMAGLSPANYFVWDGIRAVDYLLSRTEIDAGRIGIAGRSGGGTQSAYIAAMDDRILAAAPECYLTTFDKQLRSRGPQDAEQNLLYGLENGLDLADYLEVRAPKPALIVSTTRDIFSIQGTRDLFQETKKAYAALGKPDQLLMVEDDAEHMSTRKNREASYAFFQQYLTNPGSSADLEVTLFKDEELYVTPRGQVYATLKGETLFSLTQTHLRKNRSEPPGDAARLRETVRSITGYEKPASGGEVVFSGRFQRDTYAIEKYLVTGPGKYAIPVLWLKPTRKTGKTVLLLDDRGKAVAAQKGEWADQLAREGHDIIIPDLSGTGELGTGYPKDGDSIIGGVPLNLWFTGLLTHKNLVAVRAEEIEILAGFIRKSLGTPQPLAVAARGTMGPDLLHAAVLSNAFSHCILLNSLVSYQAIIDEMHYNPAFILSAVAGALPFYDLPVLAASLTAQKLLIINPVDATNREMTTERAKTAYSDALRTPAARASLNLQQNVKPEHYFSVINNWLR
ncbi:alpha/beta hydrolase [Larkinella bovis]|uniref:Alpha/beta hydrolase n=1 Tax=Larkinella bovis TaxID=683041 RepID=A0ABW0I6N5_9BACT